MAQEGLLPVEQKKSAELTQPPHLHIDRDYFTARYAVCHSFGWFAFSMVFL